MYIYIIKQIKRNKMTTIKLTNGRELKVTSTLEEVVNNYNAKENTNVKESRVNDNLTIWVNGFNVGEIQC